MNCSFFQRLFRIAKVPALVAAIIVTPAASGAVDLSVDYSASISGLPIGTATVDATLLDGEYTISGSGKVAGISALFSDGRGKVDVTGTVRDRIVKPARYSQTVVDDKKETLQMTFVNGRVADITVTPSKAEKQKNKKPNNERGKKNKKTSTKIPLEDKHHEGVLDPLSAFLFPVENMDGESVCQRRVPVFDGEHRFDVVMKLKKETQQNGSRIFVCSLAYRPIAGYKPDKKSVKFMVGNDKMEVWLAPAGSSGFVVPVEAHVNTEIGMVVVKASNIRISQ